MCDATDCSILILLNNYTLIKLVHLINYMIDATLLIPRYYTNLLVFSPCVSFSVAFSATLKSTQLLEKLVFFNSKPDSHTL